MILAGTASALKVEFSMPSIQNIQVPTNLGGALQDVASSVQNATGVDLNLTADEL